MKISARRLSRTIIGMMSRGEEIPRSILRDVPLSVLVTLAQHSDVGVRTVIASSTYTPTSLIRLLLETESEPDVLFQIASRLRIDEEMLKTGLIKAKTTDAPMTKKQRKSLVSAFRVRLSALRQEKIDRVWNAIGTVAGIALVVSIPVAVVVGLVELSPTVWVISEPIYLGSSVGCSGIGCD